MHSSQSWKNNSYIIHETSFLRKFFALNIEEISDYKNFLLLPKNLNIKGKYFEAGPFNVIPFCNFNEVSEYVSDIIPLSGLRNRRILRIRDKTLSLEKKNLMAIVNATPDSFYPGSRISEIEADIYLDKLKDLKVDIVDIGGESTRPGSLPVGPDEEWRRIRNVIELALQKGLTVSVDTYRSEIASFALDMGVHIINDVTGMENEEMARLTKRYDSGLVIMHKKGDFATMQDNPGYENVILEILDFFYRKILKTRELGIDDKIILDPGIGFGKRFEDNLDIIRFLGDFKIGYPILIGLSRKGFIGKLMDEKVEERGLSTVIFNALSLLNGADIIRVHDVEENQKLIKIINKIKEI